MTEDSNNAVSSSFLLDDDSRLDMKTVQIYVTFFILLLRLNLNSNFLYCSIPFSVDDMSKSMDTFDISDIEPPPLIRENSGFSFLLPQTN